MSKLKQLGLAMVLLFSFNGAYAQKDATTEADAAFNSHSYFDAAELYKAAYSKEKSKEEKKRILYNIGMSYYYLQDLANAEKWIKNALTLGYEDPNAQYYYADAMRRQGKYAEAMVEFEKYAEMNPSDPRGKEGVEACKNAVEWKNEPTRWEVQPEPMLNSKEGDFALVFMDKAQRKEVIFTSARPGATGNDMSGNTGAAFQALWKSKMDNKGKWSIPEAVGATINEEGVHVGTPAFNMKMNTMYYTRCAREKKEVLGCQVYFSRKQGRTFAEPTKMELGVPDTNKAAHPALGYKDEYLFFTSDMPGGFGGKDLYYVKYDKRSKTWSEPVNMGDSINTSADEMYPFVRSNGDFYFTSNREGGMGGLDIYKAVKVEKEDKWQGVENMKYPINSYSDDFSVYFMKNANKGYFSSNREGGRGGDDIWSFRWPPLKFILAGTVYDLDTGLPLPGASVSVKGTDGSSYEVVTDQLGYYEFDEIDAAGNRYIKEETMYTMEVSAEKYLNGKGQESTINVDRSTRFNHDFKLQPIGGEITFPEVQYPLASAELLVNDDINSKDSLDFLYQLLLDNPTIVIELMAHTDARGSDESNLELSDARATTCVNYLISKGIQPERLAAKGYGETKPYVSRVIVDGVVTDSTVYTEEYINSMPTVEEREALHQKNRRTTFRVLRDDYVDPNATSEEDSEETPEENDSESGAIKEEEN